MFASSSKRATRTLAVALAVAAVTALTACSSTPESGTSSSSSASSAAKADWVTPRTMPAGKGSTQDDGVFPRSVEHFQGTTELAAEPKRIVVISTGQADALLTLGVVPVGSTSGDGADLVPQYLQDAFPKQDDAIADVVDVGSRLDPDVETIASLKPDLILMNNAGKDAAALYKTLDAVAPTVATQGTGLYWKQDLLLLADALGKQQQAEQWLTSYQDEAASWGKTVTGSPTVSFLRRNADRSRVFGVASFTGSVAEDTGLSRPKAQAFTDKTSQDISAEQLTLADADWIFYGVQGGADTQITGMDLWPTLSAVQQKHTVSVDDDVFYLNVGPTAARQVLTVLEKALPSA